MKPEYLDDALINSTIIWLFFIGGLLVIAAGVVVIRMRKAPFDSAKGTPLSNGRYANSKHTAHTRVGKAEIPLSNPKESQYHKSVEKNGRDL
jgi:hypothetical protein